MIRKLLTAIAEGCIIKQATHTQRGGNCYLLTLSLLDCEVADY